jgi:hypothetical protein
MGPLTDHSAQKAITLLKSVNVDHEIMEIGFICSNLIENSDYSSNLVQNPASSDSHLLNEHSTQHYNN